MLKCCTEHVLRINGKMKSAHEVEKRNGSKDCSILSKLNFIDHAS